MEKRKLSASFLLLQKQVFSKTTQWLKITPNWTKRDTQSSESSDKSKVWINSRFRFTQFFKKRVWDPYKSREELSEYIMQAKHLCTNQKSTEGKIDSTSLSLFYFTEKEGGFFPAKLTDLIIWPDIDIKKKHYNSFSVVFFEPSGVLVFLCW